MLVDLQVIVRDKKYFFDRPIDNSCVPFPGDYLNAKMFYYTTEDYMPVKHEYMFINALVLTRIFHISTSPQSTRTLTIQLLVQA